MLDTAKYYIKKLLGRIPLPPEEKINRNGNGIINFIDVGSVGLLPEPWRSEAQLIKKLLKFEPRDAAERNENVITIDAALWDENGEMPFYIYKGLNHSGSSLFRQNYQYVKDNFEELRKRGPENLAETWFDRSQLVREETLFCRRLDDVLKDNDIREEFHFMKIDAQGAEYQILKGAEGVLKNGCYGLHLELFNIPLYEGITLLPKVQEYLKGFGFELVKKMPAHGSFDSQHDCVFLRTDVDNKETRIIKQLYKI